MLPSTLWIIMIAVGAVLVAISNINYNRAREAENKELKATQARALLYNEVQRNYQILYRLDAAVAKKTLPVETFDITAWKPYRPVICYWDYLIPNWLSGYRHTVS